MAVIKSKKQRDRLTFFIFAYWHDRRWKQFVGATVKIWDLANNLSSMGHKIIIFLPKSNIKKIPVPFTVVEVPFIDYPVIRFISFNAALFFILIVNHFSMPIHVIYVRRMSSLVPLLFAKLRAINYLYEINDDPFRKDYHEGSRIVFFLRSQLSFLIDRINIRFCDRAFVISNEIMKKIIKIVQLGNYRKLILLPSGANTDLFRPLDRKECCEKLNLNPKMEYVGFVGSLLKHQGVDTLIEAAEKLVTKNSKINLLIIGEGPMKIKWINDTNKLSCHKKIIFTGQIAYTEMPKWIAVMDVCVAPFNRQAGLRSPVKLFDYLSCGKPVVASRIEGTTDVFENTGAVILVEPEKPDLLAKAINNLLENKDKAKLMGKIGRDFIANNYDRKKLAKKVLGQAVILLNKINGRI